MSDRFSAKRSRGFPADAIPTVDFLLHGFGWFVKKTRVKTLVEPPAALSQNSANMFSPANTSISRCPQWQWK
jgi:hypothetical protein